MSEPEPAPHAEPTMRLERPSKQPVADTVAETLAALDLTLTDARGRRRANTSGELTAIASGEAVGRFTVSGQLGRGGMGQVVRARDPLLGRNLAIKVLGREDPVLEHKFIAEAVITGLLEHPSIIPVYELGFGGDGRPFLAMREVRGRTLAERLVELRAQLDAEGRDALDHGELGALLRGFLKVCDAVELAHSRGVIHRDIKPANVMIGEFGEVYLLDWGLARIVRGEGAGTLVREALADSAVTDAATGATLDGAILGTPQYMAPEQARGEVERLDHRGDVYALGVVLYELAALAPAFRGDTVVAVIEDVASGTWAPPSRRLGARRVPWELEAVIVRAMAFEPAARFQSVAELRGELERFLAGELLRSASYSPRRMLGRLWRKHRTAIALGVLALIAAVTLVAYSMREIARERDQARDAERAAVDARASAVAARTEAEAAAWRAEAARAEVERAAGREQADVLALRAKEALDHLALDEALLLASEAHQRASTPLARAIQLGVEPTSMHLGERWRFGSRLPVRTVSSADGVWVACIHGYHVEVWNLEGRRFAGRHEAAGRRMIRDVAWLDAPPRCAIVGDDGVVVVQRVGSPVAEPIALARSAIPVALEERLVAVAGTADGQWLMAGGERGELLRWPLRNTKIVVRSHHGSRVDRLLAGPDGLWLSAGGGVVRAWRDRELLAELPLDGATSALAIAPGGRYFAAAAGANLVLGTDQAQGPTATIAASRALAAIACGDDGRVVAGDDGARRPSWRANGTRAQSVRAEGRCLSLAVDPAGRYVDLARAGREVSVSRWTTRPGRDGRRLNAASPVRGLSFDAAGGQLLLGGSTSLELFELGGGTRVRGLEGVETRGVLMAPGEIAWVATPSGLRRGPIQGPLDLMGAGDAIEALAISPDGTILALDRAPTLRVHGPGALPESIALDRRSVMLAASRDWWAIGEEGGGVVIIDPATRKEVASWRAERGLDALAVAPSGHVIAGANADGVALWNPRAPGEPRMLVGLGAPTALAFLDDELLLVGDDRGALSVWDVARGLELIAFAAHAEPVTAIAVWNGRRVATAAGSAARVWGLDGWVGVATARAATGLRLDGLTPRAVSAEDGWLPCPAEDLVARWGAPR